MGWRVYRGAHWIWSLGARSTLTGGRVTCRGSIATAHDNSWQPAVDLGCGRPRRLVMREREDRIQAGGLVDRVAFPEAMNTGRRV